MEHVTGTFNGDISIGVVHWYNNFLLDWRATGEVRSTTGHNRLLAKREDTFGLLGLVEDNTGAFSGSKESSRARAPAQRSSERQARAAYFQLNLERLKL